MHFKCAALELNRITHWLTCTCITLNQIKQTPRANRKIQQDKLFITNNLSCVKIVIIGVMFAIIKSLLKYSDLLIHCIIPNVFSQNLKDFMATFASSRRWLLNTDLTVHFKMFPNEYLSDFVHFDFSIGT